MILQAFLRTEGSVSILACESHCVLWSPVSQEGRGASRAQNALRNIGRAKGAIIKYADGGDEKRNNAPVDPDLLVSVETLARPPVPRTFTRPFVRSPICSCALCRSM